MTENYDYEPPEADELSDSIQSFEDQEPTINARARDDDDSNTREQYDEQRDTAMNEPRIKEGDKLQEMQRALPVPGDIVNDPDVMMRQDHKSERNRNDNVVDNKMASRFDDKSEQKYGRHNKRDENTYDKGRYKNDVSVILNAEHDVAVDVKNDWGKHNYKKHKKLLHKDEAGNNQPKRNNNFKSITENRPDKLTHDREKDYPIDNDIELRRDKVDTFKYQKHRNWRNDDSDWHQTHNKESSLDKSQKRHDIIDSQRSQRYDETKKFKKDNDFEEKKTTKQNRFPYTRLEKYTDSRFDDLNAVKTLKSEQNRNNDVLFDTSDNERIDDNNDKFRKDEPEELQLKSHEAYKFHELSEENLKIDRLDAPYKSRFEKRHNVPINDPGPNTSNKWISDKIRQENKFKYENHDRNYRDPYKTKHNPVIQDGSDKFEYSTRGKQIQSNNRNIHDEFQPATRVPSIFKPRHQNINDYKGDEKVKQEDFRQNIGYESRYGNNKKQYVDEKYSKEKKNNRDQNLFYSNTKIKEMEREHDDIKNSNLRHDFGVDDIGDILNTKNEYLGNLKHYKSQSNQKEIPLKYDKLEQQLEQEVQRIVPNDNNNNHHKREYFQKDKSKQARYEKYKQVNNEYKYKYRQIDNNNQRISNRYNSAYKPLHRTRYVPGKQSDDNIDQRTAKHATNGINSVYVPRSRDDENNTDAVTENISSQSGNNEEPEVSRRDLLYYMDDEKLTGIAGNDNVNVDVADVPTFETRRDNSKKYKMLKVRLTTLGYIICGEYT